MTLRTLTYIPWQAVTWHNTHGSLSQPLKVENQSLLGLCLFHWCRPLSILFLYSHFLHEAPLPPLGRASLMSSRPYELSSTGQIWFSGPLILRVLANMFVWSCIWMHFPNAEFPNCFKFSIRIIWVVKNVWSFDASWCEPVRHCHWPQSETPSGKVWIVPGFKWSTIVFSGPSDILTCL